MKIMHTLRQFFLKAGYVCLALLLMLLAAGAIVWFVSKAILAIAFIIVASLLICMFFAFAWAISNIIGSFS